MRSFLMRMKTAIAIIAAIATISSVALPGGALAANSIITSFTPVVFKGVVLGPNNESVSLSIQISFGFFNGLGWRYLYQWNFVVNPFSPPVDGMNVESVGPAAVALGGNIAANAVALAVANNANNKAASNPDPGGLGPGGVVIPATPGAPPFNTVFPFITTASFTGNPTQYVFNVPPGNLNLGVNLNTTIGLVGNPVAPSGQNVAGKNWGFTYWSDGAGNDLFRWFAINPGVDSLNPGDSMTLDLFSTARPGAAGGAFPDPPAIQDVFVSFNDTMGDVSDAVEDTQEFPLLEDKCAGSKGKAAGKAASALLNCYSKAAGSGAMVDTDCLIKATTKFDTSSDKVDAKDDETDPEDGCIAGTNDTAVVEPTITAYVEDIADDLDPAFPAGTPTESKCTAGKLKCAGKKVATVLKCYSKSLSKADVVDPECDAKATLKLTDCYSKLEAKQLGGESNCQAGTDGDAPAIEAKSDDFAEAIVDHYAPGTTIARGIVSLSPTSGPSGTMVTVTVTKFPANSTVNVVFNGTVVATITTNANGMGSGMFTVPGSLANVPHQVKASSGTTFGYAYFNVTP